MEHNFNYLYKQLTGESVTVVLQKANLAKDVDFMTELMEDNHVVLLQALLENLEADSLKGSTPSCVFLFERFQADFNNLVVDFNKRLDEFNKLWIDRFHYKNMLPTLVKFDWIEKRENKFYLTGSGAPDESINFYKFTVKDAVAEGVRIIALFDGALGRLQEKIAANWHEQMTDNKNKLIPLFESSMRTKEMNELKEIRRKLPEKFMNHFCSKVKNWGESGFESQEELYQKLAEPWFKSYYHQNGFEGFVHFIREFSWEFIKYKVELFENKWRFLLRGVGHQENTLS